METERLGECMRAERVGEVHEGIVEGWGSALGQRGLGSEWKQRGWGIA